jgi:DhnA family fructose-bisphosphate aldolase class Ia
MEEIRALAEEAKAVGLAVVMWSYPRGGKLDKAGETAMDVCAYAAHMATARPTAFASSASARISSIISY